MKMLLVISRIAKMPMNDVVEAGRLELDTQHALLRPPPDRGAHPPVGRAASRRAGRSSEAIIKGKKYKGGLVIEPKPGIYFGVSVLDFASLYPSIIKVHNLSYETVNCIHEECRSNRVPDTDHWICTKEKRDREPPDRLPPRPAGSATTRCSPRTRPSRRRARTSTARSRRGSRSSSMRVSLATRWWSLPTGIKNIKDFRVGDQVINVNPETLEVEVDKVVEVQAYQYDGRHLPLRRQEVRRPRWSPPTTDS